MLKTHIIDRLGRQSEEVDGTGPTDMSVQSDMISLEKIISFVGVWSDRISSWSISKTIDFPLHFYIWLTSKKQSGRVTGQIHEVDVYLFIGMLLVDWSGHRRMALNGRLVVEFTRR